MISTLNKLVADADLKYGYDKTNPTLIKRSSYKLGLLDGYNEVSYSHKCDTADIKRWLGNDVDMECYEKGRADIKFEINKISYKSDAKF